MSMDSIRPDVTNDILARLEKEDEVRKRDMCC